MFSREKVDAVYDLRHAVEEKTRLEAEVDVRPTATAKDRLLEATLKVETCTRRAIEVCHTCGRQHQDDAQACAPASNVVAIDFADAASRKNER